MNKRIREKLFRKRIIDNQDPIEKKLWECVYNTNVLARYKKIYELYEFEDPMSIAQFNFKLYKRKLTRPRRIRRSEFLTMLNNAVNSYLDRHKSQ